MEALIQAFSQRRPQPINCLVMGGTGAVGSRLLPMLMGCQAFDKVTVLTRRKNLDGILKTPPEGFKRPQLEVVQFNFDNPEKQASVFSGHSVMFCAYGTTRKQAGSAEAFRQIDYGHVMACAKLFQAKQSPADNQAHFILVGAVGTNPNSMMLYPQTKGKLERDLHALQFPRLTILRPAMLLGRPSGRWAEDFGLRLVPMFEWMMPGRVAVHCEQVARAMLISAVSPSPLPFAQTSDTLWTVRNDRGVAEVLENSEILKLFGQYFADWKPPVQ
jgi:oxidoreductase